ncbi:hypothetical protein RO3G_16389 [Rhizopus delemar RA 99-880]|uniref:Uncharacterized protein n=1 Tax=Rhizopus delemar (strain RA 99-880 / ATCC MYA-4621 / FGSC 9543 / NRRL 43880) TaxID=246409 RepID=I1CT98_RHIO9|nr:hypothetical protein RO3G_16389 [Rhizopus delemar RA 99-880]|eukprot:EIE91678.1 hypothetical protein RO3G_16389 [Rhizopus delemar RA 99-880]
MMVKGLILLQKGLAANSSSEAKIIHDNNKLLREDKDITDRYHIAYLNHIFD